MRDSRFGELSSYILLTCGLSICMGLLLHNLDHDYIAPWDEVVHITVVHNLYSDCCDPKLHRIDLGQTEQSDWTNNYIWLHKPPLPFYLRAALYRVFGESLFLFRLPSVVFAIGTAACLFLIGKQFTHGWAPVGVALLFASNNFVFELAQGRVFSDLSDLMTACFLTVVLGLALASAEGRPLFFIQGESSKFYWTASLAGAFFSALAYLCKGGLALPGLGVFAIALIWRNGRRGLAYVFGMGLLFSALVLPQALYFGYRFPNEFRYEQSQQIAHLFSKVEDWARPWNFYMKVYWRDLLGLPLAVAGLTAIIATLLPGLRDRKGLLLVLWISSYVLPLSFGVSKIANFIFPVVPAVILLVGFRVSDLLQSELRTLLYPVAGVVVLVITLDYFKVLGQEGRHYLPVTGSLGILLVCCLLSGRAKGFGISSMLGSARLPGALAALICSGVIIETANANWYMSNYQPRDYEEQVALKATAGRIEKQIPRGAVVLVDESRMENAHLYLQYWGGVDTMPATQLGFARQTLSAGHPLYLLTKKPSTSATLVERLPYGYLYRVN